MSPASPVESAPVQKILDDDDFIERNLKELQEKKSREERKANGRLAAVIVALLLIFLAMYHAWIRITGALAGVLVPALIMILYGGWVVFLAKRDKKKRQMYEKHLEEAARKYLLAKMELGRKKRKQNDDGDKKSNDGVEMKSKKSSSTIKNNTTPINGNVNGSGVDDSVKDVRKTTKLKIENHKTPCILETSSSTVQTQQTTTSSVSTIKANKTHKKHRNKIKKDTKTPSNSSYATKDLRNKRPSFRQKLFRQNATEISIFKNKNLKRSNALSAPPPLSRTTSAP